MSDEGRAEGSEQRLAGYFARYEPAVAALGRTSRAKLRRRLPDLLELVYMYENQDALVISYSPTASGPDGVCALRLDPGGVKLFFGQGARLSKSDPGGLLQGRGKTVRHVALGSAKDLDRPEIEALMAAALKLAKPRPEASAKGAMIVKADAQKARAARKK